MDLDELRACYCGSEVRREADPNALYAILAQQYQQRYWTKLPERRLISTSGADGHRACERT